MYSVLLIGFLKPPALQVAADYWEKKAMLRPLVLNTLLIFSASLLAVAVAGESRSEESENSDQSEWEASIYPSYRNSPAMRFVKEDPRLPRALIIGDSISIGYTTRVQKLLQSKVNVWRIPVNGGSTLTGLEGLDRWLKWRGRWDVIHFNFGLHDLKRQLEGSPVPDQLDVRGKIHVPVGEYAKNLEELVLRLKQSGAQLIFANTTPIPKGAPGRVVGDALIYNAVAEKIMRKHGIRVNDLHALVLPHLAKAQPLQDVHFRDAGNDLLAQQVAADIFAVLELPRNSGTFPSEISIQDYYSIQEAIEKNPGKIIRLPAGDYEISEAIHITHDNTGLLGPGRILQTNPEQAIIKIERADNVQLRYLTLTRPAGKRETTTSSVRVWASHNVTLAELNVIDNQFLGDAGSINLQNCVNCQVRNCLVQNYTTLGIDDRTAGGDWGYAFNVIGGTGISVRDSRGTMIQGNRVIENNIRPTPKIKLRYQLGQFTKRNRQKGLIVSQEMWDAQYYNAWHQGAAIVLARGNEYTQVQDNYVENAAQGVDIHSDHVLVSGNIINDAKSGMKAMHGSRNVLILGNQFSKCSLWAIGLFPGASSHPAGYRRGDTPPMEPNVDGGHVVANNIISDFGYGSSYWMWKGKAKGAILLEVGQKPMNPPLRDVTITGNVVYNTGRYQVLVDGEPQVEPPRYQYAVYVSQGENGERGKLAGPTDIHFDNNILHAGTAGIANIELQ